MSRIHRSGIKPLLPAAWSVGLHSNLDCTRSPDTHPPHQACTAGRPTLPAELCTEISLMFTRSGPFAESAPCLLQLWANGTTIPFGSSSFQLVQEPLVNPPNSSGEQSSSI